LRIIAYIDGGFEDLGFKVGDTRPFKPAYQFLGLAAEHGTANHFNPAAAFTGKMGFNKHALTKFALK
jgi:hypothetical protein